METLSTLLLIFILVCAVTVSLTRDLLVAIILFMAQSTAMCVVWILLESPDLAITEAAVGAGVTTGSSVTAGIVGSSDTAGIVGAGVAVAVGAGVVVGTGVAVAVGAGVAVAVGAGVAVTVGAGAT